VWAREREAAFHVPQPSVSKIINGNVEKLSTEFLVGLSVRAGRRTTHHSAAA
jgi:predicted XRE-type DNA-binding protein